MSAVPTAGAATLVAVAGDDPGAGAGLQMDGRVAAALGCGFVPVIALETDQGKDGLSAVRPRAATAVGAELAAALAELRGPAALKLGALGNAAIVREVARQLVAFPDLPVVLDPVRQATSNAEAGIFLLDAAGWQACLTFLLPRADLVTPNMDEFGDGKEYAACTAILQTGGHDRGDAETVVDRLWIPGQPPQEFRHPRVADADQNHGTGCALSSAIACHLARGQSMADAVSAARALVLDWMMTGWKR